MSGLEDMPDGLRYTNDRPKEYRAWLDVAVQAELLKRLTDAEAPQTWPEIVNGFPGSYLPGREESLGRAMAYLSSISALEVTRTLMRNQVNYEWEEIRYSLNPLSRIAGI